MFLLMYKNWSRLEHFQHLRTNFHSILACLLIFPVVLKCRKRSQTFDKNNCESHFVTLTLIYRTCYDFEKRKRKRRNPLPTSVSMLRGVELLSFCRFFAKALHTIFSSHTGETQTFACQQKKMICSRQKRLSSNSMVSEKKISLFLPLCSVKHFLSLTKFNILFDGVRQQLETANRKLSSSLHSKNNENWSNIVQRFNVQQLFLLRYVCLLLWRENCDGKEKLRRELKSRKIFVCIFFMFFSAHFIHKKVDATTTSAIFSVFPPLFASVKWWRVWRMKKFNVHWEILSSLLLYNFYGIIFYEWDFLLSSVCRFVVCVAANFVRFDLVSDVSSQTKKKEETKFSLCISCGSENRLMYRILVCLDLIQNKQRPRLRAAAFRFTRLGSSSRTRQEKWTTDCEEKI